VCLGALRTPLKGIVFVKNEFRRRLSESVEAECLSRSTKGAFSAGEAATEVVVAMAANDPDWASIRDELLTETVAAMVQRFMNKAVAQAESPQGRLPFEGYEEVPRFVEVGDLWIDVAKANRGQVRACIAAYEAKIKSYEYPRRSRDAKNRDRKILAKFRQMERTIVRYGGKDSSITAEMAMDLREKRLKNRPPRARMAIAQKAAMVRRATNT
jgi:hypothetical protein